MIFKRKSILIFFMILASLISIIFILLFKTHNYSFHEDFETGQINPKCSGNCPSITQAIVHSGQYALRVHLDKNKSKINYRTEIQEAGKALYGVDYWYQFSIYLPEDYTPDNVWEIVAQWHAVPDFEKGETWRNPVLSLRTTNGIWRLKNIWDSKPNTFVDNIRQYDGFKTWEFGRYKVKEWVTWKFHIIWSHLEDGVLEVWKNNKLILSKYGPNCFNDKIGPYFKVGLYKGWKDNLEITPITQRTLYIDDISISNQSNVSAQ